MGSELQNGHGDQTAGVTASSKNASCCGLSITLWLPATRVVTLARSLPRSIDCRIIPKFTVQGMNKWKYRVNFPYTTLCNSFSVFDWLRENSLLRTLAICKYMTATFLFR